MSKVSTERRTEEVRRRINLLCWAYADLFLSVQLVEDEEFNIESRKVDLSIDTLNRTADRWFRQHFKPNTKDWITSYYDLDRIEEIAVRKITYLKEHLAKLQEKIDSV